MLFQIISTDQDLSLTQNGKWKKYITTTLFVCWLENWINWVNNCVNEKFELLKC